MEDGAVPVENRADQRIDDDDDAGDRERLVSRRTGRRELEDVSRVHLGKLTHLQP